MKRGFVAVVVACICISCLILGYLMKAEGFAAITPLHNQELHRLYHDEKIPRSNSPLLLVTEDSLYLYYDYDGIINVYSYEGIFSYCLQIESLRKGTGDLGYYNNLLYVKAPGGRIYVFEGQRIISSFRSTDDAGSYKEAESYMEGVPCNKMNGATFHVMGSKIMKSVDNGPYHTVLILPEENPDVKILAIAILFSIMGLMYYLREQKF